MNETGNFRYFVKRLSNVENVQRLLRFTSLINAHGTWNYLNQSRYFWQETTLLLHSPLNSDPYDKFERSISHENLRVLTLNPLFGVKFESSVVVDKKECTFDSRIYVSSTTRLKLNQTTYVFVYFILLYIR